MQDQHAGSHGAGVLGDLLHIVQQHVHHAGRAQRRAEDTGGHQQANGAEHAGKAAPVQHGVHHVGTRIPSIAGVHDGQDLRQAGVLADHGQYGAGGDAGHKGGQRGLLHHDQDNDHQHRQQQEGIQAEGGGDGAQDVLIDLAAHSAVAEAQAVDQEEHQGDQIGRAGGDQGVLDALHQRGLSHRGGDDRRVGQRGNLVAEEGAHADGARSGGQRHAQALGHAHAGDADGGQRAPGGAGHDAHQGAEDADDGQEQAGRQDLHAVVNHDGHGAGDHPGAHQNAHSQQNQDGHDHGGDGVLDALLQVVIGDAEAPGHQTHDDAVHRQNDTVVELHDHEAHDDDGNTHGQHQQRLPGLYDFSLCLFTHVSLSCFCLKCLQRQKKTMDSSTHKESMVKPAAENRVI